MRGAGRIQSQKCATIITVRLRTFSSPPKTDSTSLDHHPVAPTLSPWQPLMYLLILQISCSKHGSRTRRYVTFRVWLPCLSTTFSRPVRTGARVHTALLFMDEDSSVRMDRILFLQSPLMDLGLLSPPGGGPAAAGVCGFVWTGARVSLGGTPQSGIAASCGSYTLHSCLGICGNVTLSVCPSVTFPSPNSICLSVCYLSIPSKQIRIIPRVCLAWILGVGLGATEHVEGVGASTWRPQSWGGGLPCVSIWRTGR